MRRCRWHFKRRDLILVAFVSILAAACGDPSPDFGNDPAGLDAKQTTVAKAGKGGTAAVDRGELSEMDVAVMDRELQPVRRFNAESLSVDQFDAMYAELMTKHPKGALYRNQNGVATLHPAAGPNFRALPPDCRRGISGPGAYDYHGYGANVGDGKLYSLDLYATNRDPTLIGVIKSGTTLLQGISDMADYNGAMYAVNNSDVASVAYSLFQVPVTASGGVVAATLVGPLKTSAGTQVRDMQCLATGFQSVLKSGVEISWTAIGGDTGEGFNLLRSTDPNATYIQINGALIPWNAVNTYCFIDVNAPACSRVYYALQTIWHWHGVTCQANGDPFYVDTECP